MDAATNRSDRLRAAGIDPETNAGMSRLTMSHQRAIAENEGFADTIVLHRVDDSLFAFGGDASILQRSLSLPNFEPGRWRVVEIHCCQIEHVKALATGTGLRVAVVEHP